MYCVPQQSILCPVLFNIFINDWNDETKCTLIKFADGTKLGGVVDTAENLAAIQRGKQEKKKKLEKWSYWNLMKFNKEK